MSMPRFSLEIKSGTVVASISPGIYVFVSFASAHHLRIHYVDVAQFSPHVVGILSPLLLKLHVARTCVEWLAIAFIRDNDERNLFQEHRFWLT